MDDPHFQRLQEYAREKRAKVIKDHETGAAVSPTEAASIPAAKPKVDFFKSGGKDPARESAKQKALVDKMRSRGDF